MVVKRRSLGLCAVRAVLLGVTVACWTGITPGARAEPDDSPRPAAPIFRFRMPEGLWEEYEVVRREDKETSRWVQEWAEVEVSIDGDAFISALSRIRGSSSLNTDHKSLNLKLPGSRAFTGELHLRRFYLTNLHGDAAGYQTFFCYRLLQELELFPAFFQMAVVFVNDEPLGLYRLIERPQDALRRAYDDVVSIHRRRSFRDFDLKYAKDEQADALARIRDHEHVLEIEDDVHQIESLQEILDLDQYLRWVAFNSLVLNADSLDELYYAVRCSEEHPEGRISFMAWDYDDIEQEPPPARRGVDHPLLWCARNPIDEHIVTNPRLHERYRAVLLRLLQRLTPERLSAEIETVRTLLDGIDTGKEEDVQIRDRKVRMRHMARFEETLLGRHRALLESLSAENGQDR